ncbi:hypothetical protein CB1_000688081 [Camelus ferus]|nr:hypothetical protein CB1_000688081 [Camelus ferus]
MGVIAVLRSVVAMELPRRTWHSAREQGRFQSGGSRQEDLRLSGSQVFLQTSGSGRDCPHCGRDAVVVFMLPRVVEAGWALGSRCSRAIQGAEVIRKKPDDGQLNPRPERCPVAVVPVGPGSPPFSVKCGCQPLSVRQRPPGATLPFCPRATARSAGVRETHREYAWQERRTPQLVPSAPTRSALSSPGEESLFTTGDQKGKKDWSPKLYLQMKWPLLDVPASATVKDTRSPSPAHLWHNLSREEQAKYYELARKERQLHSQLYPTWSARDNYVRDAHSDPRIGFCRRKRGEGC